MINTNTPEVKKIKNIVFLKILNDTRRAKEFGIITDMAWLYYKEGTYVFELNKSPYIKSFPKPLKLRYARGIKNWYFYTDNETGGDDLSQPCNKKDLFETFYKIVMQE